MDTEALATFLAVHREGGFSAAAHVLYRTQPAISRRIALLEAELGLPLFERVAGGIVLSQAGRVLRPHAERALAALEDATRAVAALAAGEAGTVALSVVGTLADAGLVRVMKRFSADLPGVQVSLRTARSSDVSEQVRRGEATIGVRFGLDRSEDLDCEKLGAEALNVVCAANHPLAGQELGTFGPLSAERWVAFPEVPGEPELSGTHVAAFFLAVGLGQVDWMPVDSLTAQKRLVEAGFALALMPRSSIAEECAAGSIAVVRTPDLGARTPVFAVTRNGGYLSVADRRMLDLLRTDYAAGLA